MDLYLQLGHGMKSLSIELAKKWGGLKAILSPRDMNPKQMISWCADFKKNGIECLFDPQCYCPKSEQKNLIQYEYWDGKLNTNLGSVLTYEESLIEKIKIYNDIAQTFAFICPCMLKPFTDHWKRDWISENKKIVTATKKIITNKPVYATIALPSEFLVQHIDTIEDLIQEISEWDVDGYYIIAETPEKKYLVGNPLWLSNVFQLCAALKITKRKVILGYSNHQMLPLSISKIDAIASGTFLNVRSFTNRFVDTDETKRKAKWFYYPYALSEYKLAFLDSAFSNKAINDMKLSSALTSEYSDLIYKTTRLPSETNLSETTAFKFYLCSLKYQIESLNQDTYQKTVSANEVLLFTAQRTIEQLESKGIYAQARSFRDIIDINLSAIQVLKDARGFLLEMLWDSL